jgi:glycosyltransferase involved in cell wall biosynthesis
METTLESASHLFAPLNQQALFLVWAPPTLGSSRSRVFSAELGIRELHYVYSKVNRSDLTAPLRFGVQAVLTLKLLFRKRPRVVFVQSPPSVAVLFVYLYCALTGSQYVIDAHSLALQSARWTRPAWLHRRLIRSALAVIVTDDHFRAQIEGWGGRTFVLKDPVTEYPLETVQLDGSFNVTVVNSFKSDEPLEEVLKAASALPQIRFYVTGNTRKADPQILAGAPENVSFTGFLPNERYYGLLSASQAVMCLTSRDHTLQCGACEALSLEKPVITSDWPMLKEYFHQGTVHVPNTGEGIRAGILEMQKNYAAYQAEMIALRQKQRHEWEGKIEELSSLIQKALR